MAYLFVAPLVPQFPIAKESGPKLLIPMYRVLMQKDILPPRTALSRQRMAIARDKRSAGKERHFGFPEFYFFACSFNKATDRFSSIKWRRPSSLVVAPRRIRSMASAGVSAGSKANNLAARLTTFGVAIDVPDNFSLVPPGT